MSVLAARNVEAAFAGAPALGPVTLDVGAGEAVALLGPSGCGKSTLLAVLAGLLAPAKGEVAALPRPPGMVFQDASLMPWASVLANVALPLRLAGRGEAEAEEKARAALAVVGLPDVARARPAALSGGMRMRAALARAIVSDPSALLLDEPFAAIDELGRRALDDLVLRLKAERALAILFVTHSVEEAVYVADRVLVMSPRPGRVLGEIAIAAPAGVRGDAFLSGPAFQAAAAKARALLAQGVAA